MTDPRHTPATIIVLSTLGLHGGSLVIDPDWNPPLDDNPDRRFTNPDFAVAVSIMVYLFHGDRLTAHGYLIPATTEPCPLCTSRRLIVVREDLGDTAAYAAATLHAYLTEGPEAAKNVGIVDLTKPCPACQPAEYVLAADEHVQEVDL